MTACNRPGCTGTVRATGFCGTCWLRPLSDEALAEVTAVPATSVLSHSSGDPLALPVFEFPDPSSRILNDTDVPEESRKCPGENCGAPVGRSYAGQPAISEGFCPACGHPYSFVPNLHEGDLVDGQYEVIGCFARGGLGWVYLARDRRLDDNLVVLKGLIDLRYAALATAERRAMTMMDHKNIVRILNFVAHPDSAGKQREYIVMEYVDGLTLREATRQRALGTEPLRVEHVIFCVLQVLEAMEYLHRRGYLYCDMKPDNVIVRPGHRGEEDRVKVIDLGAVRKADDRESSRIGTKPFEVDEAEFQARGLTVQSDIHTVGVTLERLYTGTTDWLDQQTGATDEHLALGLESFRRLIARARHEDPDQRFDSAAQMAEQLKGVRREIASLRDGVARPDPSTVFAPTAALLDSGLGDVPPLHRWTRPDRYSGTGVPLPDGRPGAAEVAIGLPVPRVDPGDDAAEYLAVIGEPTALRLLDKLTTADLDTAESWFARCRAEIEIGRLDLAADSLRAAGREAGDWRIAWHRGLIALARDEVGQARLEFTAVYDALPGEEAPKLALGFCAEHEGELDRARRLYEAVWRRDRSQGSAAFGLTRIRLAEGDRAGAVAVLDEVPKVSRHFDAAAVAAVIILCGRLASGTPAVGDLGEAAERLPSLYLDTDGRNRLVTILREAALPLVGEPGTRFDAADVFGAVPSADGLRRLLEESYRGLAGQARNEDEHGILIDLANTIRPRTWS
ncbi:serine/threonine-protein kinase [Lentzea sp. NBRC 102530]|uniref:serine/threonine-protein kinase n=1 Tax=Lentzea sp. NBRC 102530 TaxID=3032201 RepID=UPI0024A099D0|nr:serine/threonine-protein kinase [Lentzea sp. NBRC 102530]GLY47726.1 serine/threonine protein kinase [Lentzea sp. NBRC 102530]